MSTRIVVLFGFLVVAVVGAFAIDEQMGNWQTPVQTAQAPAPAVETKPAEDKPAAPKPVDQKPAIIAVPPVEKPAPVVVAPPVQMPAPVTAPPKPAALAPSEPKPGAKPETKPAPVVVAPPPAPAPVIVAPAEPKPEAKPAPVVVAPPVEKTAPVVVAPPVQAPAPVVTAPPVQTPESVVVLPPADSAPLPPEKPAIADTKKATDIVAAKTLFAAEKLPSLGKAMAIGYYPRGCLQGGVALPVNGPTWQVMRLSRNRNWGHPSLVRFLENFAPRAAKATGWKGILVGDMAQPRGGPTPFGHMSHQTGLDVDVWFMPMPDHVLSKDEREKTSAINLVASDWKHVDPKTWTPQHAAFIRTAAEQPEVERVLVNAAIKKEMCRMQGDKHPEWMDKVRPWYAHHDHIHVRLECPPGSPNCRKQPSVPGDHGCGKALDYWFSDKVLHPKKKTDDKPRKPPKPVTLADLPPACKTVLAAPARGSND